jgi:WD40 repeat protein
MSALTTERTCPFVGPRPFLLGEGFYGRDGERLKLLDLLIAERLVLMFSPSGAGKTSLIQAGLIPALREEGFYDLPVVRVGVPTGGETAANSDSPNHYIQNVLAALAARPTEDPDQPAELTTEPVTLASAFRSCTKALPRGEDGRVQRLVLIFDQFEEILTADPTDRAAKDEFFEQLGAALKDPSVWALFAMREEYVAALEPYLNRIPRRLASRIRLELLDVTSARDAFEKPFASRGVSVVPSLTTRLLDDLSRVLVQRADGTSELVAGSHVEPVHLQIVGLRLWERGVWRGDRDVAGFTRIAEPDLISTGAGVDAALADYYAEKVREVAAGSRVSERMIRDWCEYQLLTDQGLRGQVLREPGQTRGLPEPAIRQLIDAFLVRAEDRRGSTWYELAHDRLIGPIREDNERWRQSALQEWQRASAAWAQAGEPRGLLLRGWTLSRAIRWARKARTGEVTAAESRFLAACRLARWRRSLAGLLTVAFVLTIAYAANRNRLARISYEDAEKTRRASEQSLRENRVKRGVTLCREGEVDRGMLSLAQTLAEVPDDDPNLRLAIRSQLAAWLPSLDVLRECSVGTHPAAGPSAVTAAPYGTVPESTIVDLLRDAPLGGDRDGFIKNLGPVYAARVDANHQLLLASRREYFATLRDVKTGQPTGPTFPPADLAAAEAFVFSPDRRRFVAVPGRPFDDHKKAARTARIWDSGTGHPVGDLLDHPESIRKVVFASGGKVLLTLCAGGTAWLWDATDGHRIAQISGAGSVVLGARFSPDGQTLLSLEGKDILQFRVAETGRPAGPPIRGQNDLSEVTFGGGGEYVVTPTEIKVVVPQDETSGAPDVGDREEMKTIYVVRNGRTGEPVGGAFARRGPFGDVSFTRDGRTAFVVAANSEALLWDLAGDRPVGEPYRMEHSVLLARVSPDGKTVLTGDSWSTRLCDAAERRRLTLPATNDARFSPDGKRVLLIERREEKFGGTSLIGSIWDTKSGSRLGEEFEVPLPRPLHKSEAVWAPDGETLLITGTNIRNGMEEYTIRDASGRLVDSLAPTWTLWTRVDYDISGGLSAEGLAEMAEESIDRNHKLSHVNFATDGRFVLGLDEEVAGAGGAYVWAWDAVARAGVDLHWEKWERPLAVGYSPTRTTAFTTSFTEVVRVWDLRLGRPVGEPLRHQFRVWGVALSPDVQTIVTGGADAHARFWRTGDDSSKAGSREAPAAADTGPSAWVDSTLTLDHFGPVFAVAFSPNGGRIMTGSGDKDTNAHLWDAQSRRELRSPFKHESAVCEVAFEGEGALRTRSVQGTSRVWELARGPEKREAQRHLPDQRQDRSRNGRTLTQLLGEGGDVDHGFEVRDAAGKPIGEPFWDPEWLMADLLGGGLQGVISPDGTNLLTATGDGTASLWKVDSRRRLQLPTSTEITRIAFLNDRLAITSHVDGAIEFWDASNGKPDGEPLEHGGPITALAFGPDGKTVLSGGYKEVRVWDVRTRLQVGPSLPHENPVVELAVVSGEGHAVIVTREMLKSGGTKRWEWPFPAPWDGEASRVATRVEVLTGKTLDKGKITVLRGPDWRRRRASLDARGE